MRISQYWDKMMVLRNATKGYNGKDLFITNNYPRHKNNLDETYIIKDFYKNPPTDEEIKQLSIFYTYNFKILKSNSTIFFTEKEIKDIITFNEGNIITLKKDGYLIGSIVNFLIPAGINIDVSYGTGKKINSQYSEKDIYIGVSLHLILDKSNRGKGLGMNLITESLNFLHDNDGQGAYFINKVARTKNYIPIESWVYPLNLNKLDSCRYSYPREYRSIYNINKDKISHRIDNTNLEKVHQYYMSYIKTKKIYFSPSLTYFKKWVEIFPSYFVTENNENDKIIGFFTLRKISIWQPECNSTIDYVDVILCVGKDIQKIMEQCITISRKFADVIKFFQIGDVVSMFLNKLNCILFTKNYINWYNIGKTFKPEEFYLPPM